MAREAGVEQLRAISAALDGEGPMPDDLDAGGQAFLDTASRIRSALRVEEAAVPPDVTAAVLDRIAAPPGTMPGAPPATAMRRSTLLVAAAVFVVAAVAAALLVRPGGPAGEEAALADVGGRLLVAQHAVSALDARLTLVERGAHPDVPVRRYEGTLRYRAPERLWLHLDDRTRLPGEWPPNDVDLVVDDGTAWSRGHRDCPVTAQPSCLDAPAVAVVTGLAPFAADWVAPLDLVVPADGFLPSSATVTSEDGGAVVVHATVARLRRLVDGLRAGGAIRDVHATDDVRLELDPTAFTLRRLTVTAGSSPARAAWAATNGYRDAPGAELLDLVVARQPLPDTSFPAVPDTAATTDAGFRDGGDLDGPVPARLPDGFTAHRAGRQTGAGPATEVRSWTNGRAWIRVEVTREWTSPSLFGGLGPLVRPVAVGAGTGWTDPSGAIVAVHADGVDLTVTGSVPLETLVEVAASIPVTGEADLPDDWPQGDVVTALPAGALRPEGPLTARYDGPDLLVAVPGPGSTSAVLRQRPGTLLDPPPKADVIEVDVRGVKGRYAPRLGTLTWLESGWVRELASDGLDLEGLLAAAEGLRS